MSCRTGLLRGGRPLRGVCTGFAGMILGGPPVGRDYRMTSVSGVEGLREADEVLWGDVDEAAAGAVDVGDEEEGDGEDDGKD